MENELLNYINKFSNDSSLKCNTCDKAHKCNLNHFLNYINKNGIENFSLSLNNGSLDASMVNIYENISKIYSTYKDDTMKASCGLSKDGNI